MARLRGDSEFAGIDIDSAIDASKLTGRSKEQVDEFLAEVVSPIRNRYNETTATAELRV
jgi:adenylosuccinate lyase